MAAVKRNISLLDILHQIGMDEDTDFLREGAQLLTQRLIELEATKVIGADKYERTPERCNSRNGYRDRPWETRVGNLDLRIPKLREGSFFPSFLEPRKMTEKAILSVVQEAYVHGVSTRKVDDLVRALGAYSDEIVHPFRRKASTRSGSNRPAVPVEIVRLFQAKSSTCSGSKNPVVSASPVDQVGAKRRAA